MPSGGTVLVSKQNGAIMPTTGITGERIGPLLRRLRTAQGLSEEDLADALNAAAERPTLTRSEVWRWETEYENRTPGPLWLPRIADVLHVPLERLRAARAVSREKRRLGVVDAEAPADVLARLVPADDRLSPTRTTTGRHIGMEDAEALLHRVHGLRLADDVLAGGDLVDSVVRELHRAHTLFNATCHSEDVGRRLLVAIGELGQLAGWVATDTGGRVDPGPLFRLGVAAARQAGDAPLTAHLLGSWGYALANAGAVAEGAGMIEAADTAARRGDSLRTVSLTGARRAWVAALARDSRTSLGAVQEAMDQIHAADPQEDAGRLWLYWVNQAEQEVMQARVYTELHRPLRAVPLLRRVLADYNPSHAREYALYSSWMAVALLDGGETEEAAAVAERVLTLTASVPSSRAAARGSAMLEALRRADRVPEVRRVLELADGLADVSAM
jgi:transcriptional regulator with XRE-family HTH domain